MANGVDIIAQAIAGLASGYMGQVAQRRKEQQEYRDRINYQQEIAQMEEEARTMQEQKKLKRDRRDAELFNKILNPEKFATNVGTPAPVPETTDNPLMDILNRTIIPSDPKAPTDPLFEVPNKGRMLDNSKPISTGRFVEGTVKDASKVREDALDELLQSNPTMYMNVISNLSESEQKAEVARLQQAKAMQPKQRYDLGSNIWLEYPDGRLEITDVLNPQFPVTISTTIAPDGTKIKTEYNYQGYMIKREGTYAKDTNGSGRSRSGNGEDGDYTGSGTYTNGGNYVETKDDKIKGRLIVTNNPVVQKYQSGNVDIMRSISSMEASGMVDETEIEAKWTALQKDSKAAMGFFLPMLSQPFLNDPNDPFQLNTIRGLMYNIQKKYGGGSNDTERHKNILKKTRYGVTDSELDKELTIIGKKIRQHVEQRAGMGNPNTPPNEYGQLLAGIGEYVSFAIGVNFAPYLGIGTSARTYSLK